jgi:hypothetical protein
MRKGMKFINLTLLGSGEYSFWIFNYRRRIKEFSDRLNLNLRCYIPLWSGFVVTVTNAAPPSIRITDAGCSLSLPEKTASILKIEDTVWCRGVRLTNALSSPLCSRLSTTAPPVFSLLIPSHVTWISVREYRDLAQIPEW